MIGRAGSRDAQDGDDEQDGEGHGRADEGGEDYSHDVEGGRGGGLWASGGRVSCTKASRCGVDNDAGGNKLWQQVKEAYPRVEAIVRERPLAGAADWHDALRAQGRQKERAEERTQERAEPRAWPWAWRCWG